MKSKVLLLVAATCMLYAAAAESDEQGSCDADGGCDGNATAADNIRRVQWDSEIMTSE